MDVAGRLLKVVVLVSGTTIPWAVAGCGDQWSGVAGQHATFGAGVPLLPPTDERPVVRAAQTPLPAYGGTLHVLEAGDTAVVSDPDRDLVHLVDLDKSAKRATIELSPGDIPWRIAEDEAGIVHIVLRGSGQVASIDPAAATVVSRRVACPNPRGVVANDERLWVACAGRGIIEMATDPGVPGQRLIAEGKDLRDVVVAEDVVLASSFRSSRLTVLAEGEVPPIVSGPPELDGVIPRVAPTVAWRTRNAGRGWLMVHQYARDADPSPGQSSELDWGDPSSGACSSPVNSAVTLFNADGDTLSTGSLLGVVVPVDAALSPDGDFIMIASVGSATDNLTTVAVEELLDRPVAVSCRRPTSVGVDEPVAGVDFTPDGRIVAALYEPSELLIIDGRRDERTRIPLHSDSLADTGHELFHVDTGPGLACASCHPEGGDDGRVWLTDAGPRRTQPLDAGLAGTAPFHWSGEEVDFAALVEETLVGRMGGRPQSPERADAFESWVMSIPDVNPIRATDDAAAVRGAASFEALGCAECHRGASTTRPDSIAFAGFEAIQVPMLLGVATRGPFMHDGRAATLRDAVVDMLEQTNRPLPPDDELADVVAYLETL